MTSRRSRRSKQEVDYSKFREDDLSDDDFHTSTPPPTKKIKEEKSVKTKVQKSPKPRRSVAEDNQFEEDMNRALHLSLDAQKATNKCEDNKIITKAQISSHCDDKENWEPIQSMVLTAQKAGVIRKDDDVIIEVALNTRRCKKDADYTCSSESIEDQYQPSSEDELNCDLKEHKVGHKKNVKKITRIAACEVEASVVKSTSKEQSKPRILQSSQISTNPFLKKFKQPSWTPPGVAGSSSHPKSLVTSSPSTLRIGLSRHIRVKPLHINPLKPG